MKLEAYAVFDAAVGAYNRPMFFRSRAEAVRSFQDAVRDPQSSLGAHARDYSWCYVGDFDDSSGMFEPVSGPPVRVCGALDFVVGDEPTA